MIQSKFIATGKQNLYLLLTLIKPNINADEEYNKAQVAEYMCIKAAIGMWPPTPFSLFIQHIFCKNFIFQTNDTTLIFETNRHKEEEPKGQW